MVIPINVADEFLPQILESRHSVQMYITPGGVILYRLLDLVSEGQPLAIVEAGSMRDTRPDSLFSDGWSTWYLARWVKDNPGSKLTSIELEVSAIKNTKVFLKQHNLENHVSFIRGDSIEYLSLLTKADVIFLDTCDGLEHGLHEFKTALLANPRLIIMDDWDTKAQMAAMYAVEQKIHTIRIQRYTVFNLTGKKLELTPEQEKGLF